jgi:PQQ-like domain
VHCLDTATGAHVWKHETSAAIWGSLLLARDRLYVGNVEGGVTVLRAGRRKELLGQMEMDAPLYSAPALLGDALYLATANRLYFIAATPSSSPSVTQLPPAPTDAAAINFAKTAIVRDLDATLPRITIEAWLRELLGAQIEMKWSVNDCGEQTGNPADRGRDFPLCAEVDMPLSGDRKLGVLLMVGSRYKGLNPDRPQFRYAYVLGPRNDLKFIDKIAELPKQIGK